MKSMFFELYCLLVAIEATTCAYRKLDQLACSGLKGKCAMSKSLVLDIIELFILPILRIEIFYF
jgi:hypothetical protein